MIKNYVSAGCLAGLLSLSACSPRYTVSDISGMRIAMTEQYDQPDGLRTADILNEYKMRIDSLMSPVIGHSADNLQPFRPESPLSNWIADVIRQRTGLLTGTPVDVAVMNMGGIRSSLPAGEITYGMVFEIAPFENTLCQLTMDGNTLMKLFEQIAAVHGEGLSGANLVISSDGKLLSAEVGGKAVDLSATYQVATIDYLAEGNDKMSAFRLAKSKILLPDALLRDALVACVEECEQQGALIQAKVEGRIVVKP